MVHIFWQRMRQIALMLPALLPTTRHRQSLAQQGNTLLRCRQVTHMVLLSLLLFLAGMGTVARTPIVARDVLPTLVAARVGDIHVSYRRVVATMRADGMVTLTLRDHDSGLRYTLTQPVGTKVVTRKTDGGTAVLTRLPAVPEQIDLEKYPFPTQSIETIKKGQQVISRDPNTGKTEIKTVAQTFVHTVNAIIQLDLADKTTGKTVESIKGTPEHPFFTPHGMVAMGELKPGMDVNTRNNDELLVVKAVKRESHPEGIPIYNFETEDNHTYFVGQANGGVLVHNLGDCGAKLPNKVIVDEDGVSVSQYYRSGDHGPVHFHVEGEGPSVRIGQNGNPLGKPLPGNPKLSPTQRTVVDNNKALIRRAAKQIMKWYRSNQ